MNKIEPTQRIEYIDILKGLAIFLVVMGHVLAWSYNDWGSATKQNNIGTILWNVIYSFHMPLFTFVSGYVVFNPKKTYMIPDISKRLVQYLVPFFFVGVVLYYYRNDPSGIYNYWYLRALSEYVVMLFLLNLVFRKFTYVSTISVLVEAVIYVVIFYSINMLISEDTLIDLIFCKKHLNLYTYFILGWYVRRNKWIEEKVLSCKWILPLALISLYIYVVFGVFKQTLLTLSGILATYAISKSLVGTQIATVIKQWGLFSMEIYMLHFFFLFAAPVIGDYFLTITHLPTAVFMQFSYGMLVSVVNIFICILLAKLFHKNTILSFFFFGKFNFISWPK